MNKNITIGIVVTLLVFGGVYWYLSTTGEAVAPTSESITDTSRMASTTTEQASEGKLKAANFSGTLEEVNTGCFADAECYVVVDGKHITVIMGWSRETVGSVIGVEGFGDLEGHIGQQIEVYAQGKSDGTYTLYGSEGFYIKLK